VSAPVRPEERLVYLDILRGFGLLGILLLNFEYFSRASVNIAQRADSALGDVNRAVDITI
jgi:uncharacterized membrane protein YeiB